MKGNQAASFVFYQLDQFTIPNTTKDRQMKEMKNVTDHRF